jgi:hypothetical protein
MTLATHAVVGAAVAGLFPAHPVVAFSAAFISHFALDSLPHWDYKLFSVKENQSKPLGIEIVFGKNFFIDCLRILIDILIGTVLSILIFYYLFHYASLNIIFLGIVAGILPDPLQAVYWASESRLFLPLQKFHIWIQKGKSLEVKWWAGLSLQLILVVIVSVSVLLFSHH